MRLAIGRALLWLIEPAQKEQLGPLQDYDKWLNPPDGLETYRRWLNRLPHSTQLERHA
jgi:hypothetical protein